MYHVCTHGVDERMINVHYYYYYYHVGGEGASVTVGLVVEVLLYVHRRRLIRDGGAQDVHLDFHTAPELCPWVFALGRLK